MTSHLINEQLILCSRHILHVSGLDISGGVTSPLRNMADRGRTVRSYLEQCHQRLLCDPRLSHTGNVGKIMVTENRAAHRVPLCGGAVQSGRGHKSSELNTWVSIININLLGRNMSKLNESSPHVARGRHSSLTQTSPPSLFVAVTAQAPQFLMSSLPRWQQESLPAQFEWKRNNPQTIQITAAAPH